MKHMITVLMSTYNGEKYLQAQIDSILNQKNVEVQLLVRDDGSTDNTINILNAYKKLNNNVDWYKGPNLGAGKSFYQLILDAPKSTYYAFADQDDVWDDDKLAVGVSKIKVYSNTIPSLYCSVARPVDADLNDLETHKHTPVNVTLGIALLQAITQGCSYVFNKPLLDSFRKAGMDAIDFHDWALLRVTAAINGYIFFDTQSHFSYRQHDDNVVGYKNSFRDLWIGRFKRFSKKEYRLIRYDMATKIKATYYEEMTESNQKIIDTFINYNLNLKNKVQLLKSKDIRMVKTMDNVIFKILVIFNAF